MTVSTCQWGAQQENMLFGGFIMVYKDQSPSRTFHRLYWKVPPHTHFPIKAATLTTVIHFAEKPLLVASKSETMSWTSAGVLFDTNSFSEGSFQRAYFGIYTAPWAPPEKAGLKCVVKELKYSCTWNPNDWYSTVKIQQESQRLADGFNQYYSTRFPNSISFPIRFTDVQIQQVIFKQPPLTTRPLLSEFVTVEDYIPGQFKKWVNNCGYVSDEFMSMPAFAHWSWCYTNGEKMIADLQGVRGFMNYTLTDPVLLSGSANGGIYGCTDTGIEGIRLFFYNHHCNILCGHLPRPTLASLGISQWQ
jgi:hypothetical protein